MPRNCRATLLFAALGVSACSNSSRNPTPPPVQPPTGVDFSAYLPALDGDVYEFLFGLELRITIPRHRYFGPTGGRVRRVAFRDGPVEYGLYIEHGDPRGSLIRGVFDTGLDQEVLFETAQPMWGPAGVRRVVAQAFAPIGSLQPRVTGSGTIEYVHPGHTIPPPLIHFTTPYRRWLWQEILWPHWKIAFEPTLAHRDLDLQLGCGPGFGPVQAILNGQPFTTLRLRRPGHTTEELHQPK